MDLLKKLQNSLTRGIDALRGPLPTLMAPGAGAAITPQVVPAAVANKPWEPKLLDNPDFVAGATWRPGEFFTLAYFRVPTGTRYKIPEGQPFQLFLPAINRFNGQNLGAPAARVVNIPGLTDSPGSSPALPSKFHPDVQVWAEVGGVFQRCDVTAINYNTGDVTFTEPAGVPNAAGKVEVYYLHTSGEWRLRAIREQGNSDTSAAMAANGSMGALHTTDQISSETGFFWPAALDLVQRNQLALEVRSSLEIVWNSRTHALININSYRQEIEVIDSRRLAAVAEVQARRGL